MSAAMQSFIDSVKRALDHDGADQWLSVAEYDDAIQELTWYIQDLGEKARARRNALNARKVQP